MFVHVDLLQVCVCAPVVCVQRVNAEEDVCVGSVPLEVLPAARSVPAQLLQHHVRGNLLFNLYLTRQGSLEQILIFNDGLPLRC